MPRFAANVTTMYQELPFLERFDAATADGFTAVECQFPYEHAAAEIATRLRATPLELVLLNAPPGREGERGTTGLVGRSIDFRSDFRRALEYAEVLGCPRIHVMAGVVPESGRAEAMRTYRENLAWAVEQVAAQGITVLIEPINRTDVPGYLLSRQDDAHRIVQEVDSPYLRVQLDLYHLQMTEGNVTSRLRADLPTGRVGHVQVSSVPGRHEPDSGELNCRYLFGVLDDLQYDGWVGCEYSPRGGTRQGLGWLTEYR